MKTLTFTQKVCGGAGPWSVLALRMRMLPVSRA